MGVIPKYTQHAAIQGTLCMFLCGRLLLCPCYFCQGQGDPVSVIWDEIARCSSCTFTSRKTLKKKKSVMAPQKPAQWHNNTTTQLLKKKRKKKKICFFLCKISPPPAVKLQTGETTHSENTHSEWKDELFTDLSAFRSGTLLRLRLTSSSDTIWQSHINTVESPTAELHVSDVLHTQTHRDRRVRLSHAIAAVRFKEE